MTDVFDERRYLVPFRSALLPQLFADVLVVGSGVAGLRAAIAASEAGKEEVVLSKGDASTSSTAWAQGGIAGAVHPDDEPELHAKDTVDAGAGLCDPDMVDLLCREGPDEIRTLMDWGMRFDLEDDGSPSLGREGGHLRPRILHTDGAATGAALVSTLLRRAASARAIRVFEQCTAIDLLSTDVEPGSPVIGVLTHHPRHGLQVIWAGSVVLAGGGAGRLYRETTNPKTSTGEAVAMAWRAGATVADTEFVQFHPTTLYVAGSVRALLSEAVRGEGAIIVDRRGEPVMDGVHPLGDLAPRDVVTPDHRGARRIRRFMRLRRCEADRGRTRGPVPDAGGAAAGVRDRSRDDAHPGPSSRPLHDRRRAGGRHGATRVPASSPVARWPRTASMARTGWRATRCSRGSSSVATPRPGGAGFGEDTGRRPRLLAEARSVARAARPDRRRASLRSAMWRNVGILRDGGKLEDALDMVDFWGHYCLDKTFDDVEAGRSGECSPPRDW